MGKNGANSFKSALIMAIGTFILACLFTIVSELVLPKIQRIVVSFLFLLLIILIGIIFDIIGIAAAAADEHPFHAKAAKKVVGAGHAIKIVRNADRVASFCNDVVGDICGTVSGVLGAAIVVKILAEYPSFSNSVLTMVITGLIAAITVGGKALGKSKAIEDSVAIIFRVGQALSWIERGTGIDLLQRNNARKNKDRRKG